MDNDELQFWRSHLGYHLSVEQVDTVLSVCGPGLSQLIAELEQYRKDRAAEERRAWDGYAAGYAGSWTDGDPGSPNAASYADRLLELRRERFPAPGGGK